MNLHYMANPFGLPVPSAAVPEPNYFPGNAFENARVDHWADGRSLLFAVEGHIFSKGMFHMLKEYRNWEGLMRGDIAILGRVQLNDNYLDLIVMDDKDGYLRASSICLQEIKAQAPEVQHFLNRQLTRAPFIRTREHMTIPHINRSTH